MWLIGVNFVWQATVFFNVVALEHDDGRHDAAIFVFVVPVLLCRFPALWRTVHDWYRYALPVLLYCGFDDFVEVVHDGLVHVLYTNSKRFVCIAAR